MIPTARVMRMLLLLCLAWAACGQSSPEVRLQLSEDDSLPCMGAAHLRIQIQFPNHTPPTQVFDEFDLFFDTEQFTCRLPRELRFPNLPLGSEISLELRLTDSSSGEQGVLAAATSPSFSISGDSSSIDLTVDLYRQPGVKLGTVVIVKPDTWGNISNIESLEFTVTREGETVPIRADLFDWDPLLRPDPFPLVISNLPATEFLEAYDILVEGFDDQDPPQKARAWRGVAYLQAGSVPTISIKI